MTIIIDQTPTNLVDRIKSKIKRIFRDVERKRLRKKIIALPPSPARNTVQDFSLHMLLCHRDLEMAICAAKSFILVSNQAYLFTFHDDSSLTDRDKLILTAHFPGCTIIDYRASLEKAKQKFGEDSEIFKMRMKGVMMLKLIDIRLFTNKKKALLLDSDILFFEYPSAIFEAILEDQACNFFNRDIETCYMTNQLDLEEIAGHQLPERINAGLSVLDTESIKFEVLEEWLKAIKSKNLPVLMHRIEQTLISMLSARTPYQALHFPETYDVSFFKGVKSSVCKHYVGKIRHGFETEGLVYLLNAKQFEQRWKAFIQ